MDFYTMARLAAGLAIGLGAIGPGIGIGLATMGAVQAIGRNPDTEGPVRTTLILAPRWPKRWPSMRSWLPWLLFVAG